MEPRKRGGRHEERVLNEPDYDDKRKRRNYHAFAIFLMISGLMLLLAFLHSLQKPIVVQKEEEEVFVPKFIPGKPLPKIVAPGVEEEKTPPPRAPQKPIRIAKDSEQQKHDTYIRHLHRLAEDQIDDIRALKASGVVMETNETGLFAIKKAQSTLHKYLTLKWGHGPYYVKIDLHFPKSMPGYHLQQKHTQTAFIIIEMADVAKVPYSIYYFLQHVHFFRGGSFHRVAGHVLQAMVSHVDKHSVKGLAWQEYHPDVQHRPHTLGFAGRPGGPSFYISTQDNTENHGPGSQGSKTEADSCFGRIYYGQDVVERMKDQPGTEGPNGFIPKAEHWIRIGSMKMLTLGEAKKVIADEEEARRNRRPMIGTDKPTPMRKNLVTDGKEIPPTNNN
jgi:cyclophilin family peptidyl-prolyl cis-trans isomerase